jgi:ubiquinone/menaquinone biosynthesis C-methylase UbiE
MADKTDLTQHDLHHKHVGRFGDWAQRYNFSPLQLTVFGPVQRMTLRALYNSLGFKKLQVAKILDIGCGTGQLLVRIGRLCPDTKLFGVDPAQGMLEVAQKAATHSNAEIQLTEAYAEDLPFFSSSFDAVTTTISFHHWANQKQGLAEVRRVLKPGGTFVLIDIMEGGAFRPLLAPINHGYFHTTRRLTDMLEEAGFKVISSRPLMHLLGSVRCYICQ